jgi:hypothetical protein
MMDREWKAILSRHGQTVTLINGAEKRSLRAFLQPVLDKGEGERPSPLGLRREDRYLYLGPAEEPLTVGETLVEWQGRQYEVSSAHPVGASSTHHWWAVLLPREEAVL